jgi:CRP/FNR family transcriptional regulator
VFRTPSGKRLLIRFCGPGDLLEGALSEEHVVSAVAVDGAVVSFIPHKSALGLLKRQPELAVEVGCRLVRDRHMLLDRLAYFAYGGVRERLARGLLELGKHYGVRYEQGLLIDLPLSRQDLAELLGCSRQTASEELHKLVGMRLIQLRQGTIILTDMEGLRRLR